MRPSDLELRNQQVFWPNTSPSRRTTGFEIRRAVTCANPELIDLGSVVAPLVSGTDSYGSVSEAKRSRAAESAGFWVRATVGAGHETVKMRLFSAKMASPARVPSLTTTDHFVGSPRFQAVTPSREHVLHALMSDQTLGRVRVVGVHNTVHSSHFDIPLYVRCMRVRVTGTVTGTSTRGHFTAACGPTISVEGIALISVPS